MSHQQKSPTESCLSLNAYDNQVYAFGKGPSAVTVSAPTVGVATNTPITITGTVMDVSAGSKQNAVAANFPNGLPCVSDESQSKWMEYVYQQQVKPTHTTGVPITISVIDSNHNDRVIGTTTSDDSGTFGFTWTPDISGDYRITATFAGSESYWPSSASTYSYASDVVTPAPTAAPQQGLATTSDLITDLAVGVIAIIIAVAIVGCAHTSKTHKIAKPNSLFLFLIIELTVNMLVPLMSSLAFKNCQNQYLRVKQRFIP